MIPDLKPYPKMKDSGVPWLGDVPDHWNVRRQRNVVQMLVSTVDKHTIEAEIPVRLCNYVDVYKNDRITDQIAFMRASASQAEVERFRLRRGDVVITKDSESWNDIGVPVLVEYEAPDLVCGYHLAILRPHNQVSTGGYLFRALQSQGVAVQYHVSANGVTRYGLSHDAIKSVILPIPPLPEQAAIARFLDYVYRRIRRYIRAQRKLIALLEEQKQALIHRAVTRGLDPDVPLKPSGVPRLGDVPAHWTIKPLKHAVKINAKVLPETTPSDYEFRYLDIGTVGTGLLTGRMQKLVFGNAPSRARRVLRQGDTIISTVRTYLKAVYFVEDATDLIASTGFAVLTPQEGIQPRFVSFLVQSDSFTDRVTANSVGTSYPAIAETRLAAFHVAIPPLAEQTAIARFLNEATASLDHKTAGAQRRIDLFREYRTRLIADVVTGKVDVREAAAKLPEESDQPEPLHYADAFAYSDDAMTQDLDAIAEEVEA